MFGESHVSEFDIALMGGNVLIPEDEKNFCACYAVTCFYLFCCFLEELLIFRRTCNSDEKFGKLESVVQNIKTI